MRVHAHLHPPRKAAHACTSVCGCMFALKSTWARWQVPKPRGYATTTLLLLLGTSGWYHCPGAGLLEAEAQVALNRNRSFDHSKHGMRHAITQPSTGCPRICPTLAVTPTS